MRGFNLGPQLLLGESAEVPKVQRRKARTTQKEQAMKTNWKENFYKEQRDHAETRAESLQRFQEKIGVQVTLDAANKRIDILLSVLEKMTEH